MATAASRTAKKRTAPTRGNMSVSRVEAERLYTTMRRIRAFEERTVKLFNEGIVKGTAHSYIGEEAIAAGVCANLNDDDFIGSYHRGHGHCIAKGADVDKMMAELMGRDTGYCRGLGGSMHIADMDLNILGANGIVGAAMPLCTGAGLAAKLRDQGQVVVAFFGDGASNQGIFHESLNLASVWNLPVVFVCENNQYALTTSYRNSTSVQQISIRAVGYDMPGLTVDGNDAVEVYNVVGEAVARAREGGGPTLIEAMTYRWGQHSMRANLADPRPQDEYDEWVARDPIKRMDWLFSLDCTDKSQSWAIAEATASTHSTYAVSSDSMIRAPTRKLDSLGRHQTTSTIRPKGWAWLPRNTLAGSRAPRERGSSAVRQRPLAEISRIPQTRPRSSAPVSSGKPDSSSSIALARAVRR